jgi:hypothetical protein
MRCHVPYGSEPHLPTEMGSSASMCPMALDLTSRLRWAPVLPHARSSRLHLPSEVGSGAVTCPMAPDLVSRLK